MWENATYGPGTDPGILQLADGPIGCPERLRVGAVAHRRAAARARAARRRRHVLPVVPDVEGDEALLLGPRAPDDAAARARDARPGGAHRRGAGRPRLPRRRRRDGDAVRAVARVADDHGRRDDHHRRGRRDPRAPGVRGRRGLRLRGRRVGGAAPARPGAADVLAHVDARQRARHLVRRERPRPAALRDEEGAPPPPLPARPRLRARSARTTSRPPRTRTPSRSSLRPWAARGPSWAS